MRLNIQKKNQFSVSPTSFCGCQMCTCSVTVKRQDIKKWKVGELRALGVRSAECGVRSAEYAPGLLKKGKKEMTVHF